MENRKITLERVKYPAYTVIVPSYATETGREERYVFPAYKKGNDRPRTKQVSEEAYRWMLDETTCFASGSLRVVEDEIGQEYVEEILDDTYKSNSHSREGIEKILKMSDKKMEEELSAITDILEKQLVVEVAKAIGIESAKKQTKIVRSLYGEEVEVESIFPVE